MLQIIKHFRRNKLLCISYLVKWFSFLQIVTDFFPWAQPSTYSMDTGFFPQCKVDGVVF